MIWSEDSEEELSVEVIVGVCRGGDKGVESPEGEDEWDIIKSVVVVVVMEVVKSSICQSGRRVCEGFMCWSSTRDVTDFFT